MNRNPDVYRWLKAYDNPMRPVVAAMRDLILKSDPRVEEAIKWQALTFIAFGRLCHFNVRCPTPLR